MNTLLSFWKSFRLNPVTFKDVSIMRRFMTLLMGIFLLSSCGSIRGSVPLRHPPIELLVFENGTEEPILEQALFPIFKEVFIARKIRIKHNLSEAAYTLSGRINRFDSVFKSLNAQGQASEYRITVGVECTLYQKGKTDPLMKVLLTESADYFANVNPSANRDAQDRAFREASLRLAERGADKISDFFFQERP
jgi:hypothetical protein